MVCWSMKEFVYKKLIEKVRTYLAGSSIYRGLQVKKKSEGEGWLCKLLPSCNNYQLCSIFKEFYSDKLVRITSKLI